MRLITTAFGFLFALLFSVSTSAAESANPFEIPNGAFKRNVHSALSRNGFITVYDDDGNVAASNEKKSLQLTIKTTTNAGGYIASIEYVADINLGGAPNYAYMSYIRERLAVAAMFMGGFLPVDPPTFAQHVGTPLVNINLLEADAYSAAIKKNSPGSSTQFAVHAENIVMEKSNMRQVRLTITPMERVQ